MIAGLEDISGGDVEIDGDVVNEISPSDRGIALELVEQLGENALAYVVLEGGRMVVAKIDSEALPQPGERVGVTFDDARHMSSTAPGCLSRLRSPTRSTPG